MKKIFVLSITVLLCGAASTINAADRALVVTSSNSAANQLLVYDETNGLVQAVSTRP